jgi:hypothetical protein
MSINPDLDGKLVYVQGTVQSLEVCEIRDNLLPSVTASDALEIHRVVERMNVTEAAKNWVEMTEADPNYPNVESRTATANVRIGLSPYQIDQSLLAGIQAINPLPVVLK